jgi:hypothetical protein
MSLMIVPEMPGPRRIRIGVRILVRVLVAVVWIHGIVTDRARGEQGQGEGDGQDLPHVITLKQRMCPLHAFCAGQSA